MNKDQAYYAKKYKQQGWNRRFMVIDGLWYDENLGRYIKHYRPRQSAYLKKRCNKKVRRMNIEVGREKSQYRKCTQFWWELY